MTPERKNDEKLRDVTRRTIMDRTAHLLVKKGYGETSLRDIANACEMKAGSLYYHFESKDVLIEEVLSQGVMRVDTAVRTALAKAAAQDPLARIHLAMEIHLETLHDASDYGSAHIRCFAHMPPKIRRRLRDVRRRYETIWTTLLKEAQETGEIAGDLDMETLKFAIIGMMNWTLEWHHPAQTPNAAIADQFFRIAFGGAKNG